MSVLFVDLVDFTAFAERLDAEDVREAQGRYFEAARGVVAHHGGTLEKFIGDAIMAVWGTPTSRENDSERAVRAGLEVLRLVPSIAVVGERRLVARAGVATGEAAVTLPAAGEGLVAGDLVNTAARLQKLAQPGELLVDATTRQLAHDTVDFEALGERRLRGKRQPVHVWRAGGTRPRRRRGAHDGPFVGRDEELGQLKSFVADALDRRGPTCAFVSGIAGIGKSRLCWELQLWLARERPDIGWLAGRASDYGDAGSYGPLADIVRTHLGVPERAGRTTVRRAIKSAVEALASAEPERRWFNTALEALLLPGTRSTVEREDLFAAWHGFLELAGAARPSVLVFEDAQWARAELLEFISRLARSAGPGRLALIVVARPELRGLDVASNVARLRLGPLADSAMDQLSAALSPELSAGARELVRQRADGVPLYAVELVRMLLDQGTLAGHTLDLPADQLPTTLRALLSARIDALPAEPRTSLLVASVLGQRFASAALAGVGADPSHLPLLVERDFLAADNDSLNFVQGLVREVAYGTLARRERRLHQLSAAAWYESQGASAAEPRAEHLWSAHSLSRDEPDAVAVASRAQEALVAAAEVATTGAAPLAALGHLRRALTLASDPAHAADLHERAGTAARMAAELAGAETHFRAAVELRKELGQAREAARATAQLAGVLLLGQQNESALRELDAAWHAVDATETDTALAELCGQLARVHMIQGNNTQAIAWADRALELAQALSADALAVEARVTRGTARVRLGDDSGFDELRDAANAAENAGLLSAQLRALNNLSWLLVPEDPRAAMATATDAAALAQRVGSREMAMQLANVAGTASVDTGDWAMAAEELERALADDVPMVFRIDAAVTRTVIAAHRGEADPGRFIDQLGRLDRSLDAQQRAMIGYARATLAFARQDAIEAHRLAARAARHLVSVDRLNALVLAGRAALWADDVAAARGLLRQLDSLPIHGQVAGAARETLLAGIAARSGRLAEADSLYDRAEQKWGELGLPVQLGLAQRERAEFQRS